MFIDLAFRLLYLLLFGVGVILIRALLAEIDRQLRPKKGRWGSKFPHRPKKATRSSHSHGSTSHPQPATNPKTNIQPPSQPSRSTPPKNSQQRRHQSQHCHPRRRNCRRRQSHPKHRGSTSPPRRAINPKINPKINTHLPSQLHPHQASLMHCHCCQSNPFHPSRAIYL